MCAPSSRVYVKHPFSWCSITPLTVCHSTSAKRCIRAPLRCCLEKTGNSTHCHPKPLNRSSQKVAHVITSWVSTDMQNLVAIPPGVSFPPMREIAHQNVYSASFLDSSNELQPRRLNRFSRAIRQTTRFRARMCLFGVRIQKFNIYTP